MPIYCYKCFDCNHYEEIIQKFNDESLSICPECGGGQFKRIIKNVGVIFKGSGFHVTDYKSKNSALKDSDAEKKNDAPVTEKTGNSETKADTKKDEKSESRQKTESSDTKTGSSDKKDAA
jgi:putative FmdB family regulatory protein